ncbi:MAG TPA: hypothetical protein VNH11_27530 [Pirellulales bacterium]|nr:hypothetical protein [Pirellulales bacterium]
MKLQEYEAIIDGIESGQTRASVEWFEWALLAVAGDCRRALYGADTLVFGVREESGRIARLSRAVETELRAAARWVGNVLVVPAVLRLGPEAAAGDNLYELWLNGQAAVVDGSIRPRAASHGS